MAKSSWDRGQHRLRKPRKRRTASRRALQLERLEGRELLVNNPLVITEINYNPPHEASAPADNDDYEFIELYNAGNATISLGGVNISAREGTSTPKFNLTLPAGTLEPGEYGLVVRDQSAIASRYAEYDPSIQAKIVGTYGVEGLPNASSTATPASIRLAAPGVNQTASVISVVYDDGGDFPGRPDGGGTSLVFRDPSLIANAANANSANAAYADGGNWRGSVEYWGNPGQLGLDEYETRVVVNEVLANSPVGSFDTIELANISGDPVDISGWMLTDNENDDVGTENVLHAYFVPNGTILQPGGYYSVNETLFNANSATNPNAFALSSGGGSVFLVSKDPSGVRFYEDGITFDATRQSQSIGRAPNLTGSFLPLASQTFGAANSAHAQSDIVITEIMYKRTPENTNLNFIELFNTTNQSINVGAQTAWMVDGVGFTFSTLNPQPNIPAQSAAVIVAFNPVTSPTLAATFRSTYGISASVPLYGPFTTNLSNNGERLTLLAPYSDPGGGTTRVLVDSVNFDDDSPWPEGPAGGIPQGAPTTMYSLNRVVATNVGDLPHSWRGALPTPGSYSPVSTTSPLEGIVVTEVMYNPLPDAFDDQGNPLSSNHLEFVEILNTTGAAKNLSHSGIDQGVSYRFPLNTTIAADERIVLVAFDPAIASAERDRFLARYGLALGDVRLIGPWVGSLNNGGEGIALVDGIGNTYLEFTYNDRGGWPERAAGNGSSLELVNPAAVPTGVANTTPYLNNPANWRASTEFHGSPGVAGAGAVAATIVINEVQSHTDPDYSDAVELFNVSASPVNLLEWVITDSITDGTHWTFLPDITLQPGEYITFDRCVLANPQECIPTPLNFNIDAAEGDHLYLLKSDPLLGLPESFVDDIEVPATFGDEVLSGGVSQGRWPNGSGQLFPMQSRTISQFNTNPRPGIVYTDGANSGPRTFEVVISEVMYNPSGANPNDFEFIELQNRNAITTNLGPRQQTSPCPGAPEQTICWVDNQPEGWRLRGSVDFDFTSAHSIPPLGTLLLVSFDPADTTKAAAFRTRWGLTPSTPLVGPFIGFQTIPDDGGVLVLEKPDLSPTTVLDGEEFTPNVMVDRVTYDDAAPWPTTPDGAGQSLTRMNSTAFGDFSTSWTGATPTPGSIGTPAAPPKVTSVILSGTTWSTAFKNAVTTGGSPVQGYTVPKGANQTLALPWSGVNQVSITFDRAVTISNSALAISGVNTASYSISPTPTNPSGFTYTWTVNTPITGDKLLIKLDDARVNASGQMLDGEWTDGVTTGNSGNGTAGGDFNFRVNVLPGDVDGDGDVQQDDRMDVRLAMFTAPGTGSYDVRRDLNTSGHINVVDSIAARNIGDRTLPAGTPSSPAAPDGIVAQANRTSRRPAAAVRAIARAAAVDRVLADSLLVGSSGDPSEGATALRARRTVRAP